MLVLLAERADTRNYTGERPEVPQADGLPEQPNQPASTDQQSCGADQPYVSLLGEGAVQVAASKDAGPVRGPDTRRRLERLGTPNGTRGRSLKTRQTRQGATPSQTSITSSRVIIWWRSVRSLEGSDKVANQAQQEARTQAAFRSGEERKGDSPDLGLTSPVNSQNTAPRSCFQAVASGGQIKSRLFSPLATTV